MHGHRLPSPLTQEPLHLVKQVSRHGGIHGAPKVDRLPAHHGIVPVSRHDLAAAAHGRMFAPLANTVAVVARMDRVLQHPAHGRA